MLQTGGSEEVDDEEEEIEAPQYPGYCSLFIYSRAVLCLGQDFWGGGGHRCLST